MATAPMVQSKKGRKATEAPDAHTNRPNHSELGARNAATVVQDKAGGLTLHDDGAENSFPHSKSNANASSTASDVNKYSSRKPRRGQRYSPDGITLEKCFVYFGSLVALTIILVFAMDLISGWPFWRASISWDIAAVICGVGLAYLCWDTHRDFLR